MYGDGEGDRKLEKPMIDKTETGKDTSQRSAVHVKATSLLLLPTPFHAVHMGMSYRSRGKKVKETEWERRATHKLGIVAISLLKRGQGGRLSIYNSGSTYHFVFHPMDDAQRLNDLHPREDKDGRKTVTMAHLVASSARHAAPSHPLRGDKLARRLSVPECFIMLLPLTLSLLQAKEAQD